MEQFSECMVLTIISEVFVTSYGLVNPYQSVICVNALVAVQTAMKSPATLDLLCAFSPSDSDVTPDDITA